MRLKEQTTPVGSNLAYRWLIIPASTLYCFHQSTLNTSKGVAVHEMCVAIDLVSEETCSRSA